MRWENLFDDLEGQLEYEHDAAETDLRAEEERLRLSRLSLRDRLMAIADGRATGAIRPLGLQLRDGSPLSVQPTTFGKDWLAGDLIGAADAQIVLPFAAIASVRVDATALEDSIEPAADVSTRLVDRLGFAFVLRDFCRRRSALDVRLAEGVVHGTIDRVGRDHLDLAVHERGSARRRANVREYRLVPFDAIVLVRR
jgi:hypothetical protein